MLERTKYFLAGSLISLSAIGCVTTSTENISKIEYRKISQEDLQKILNQNPSQEYKEKETTLPDTIFYPSPDFRPQIEFPLLNISPYRSSKYRNVKVA